jgi:VIT1/CCC1 family predicted Fe2+/Mn2+ transporter
MSEEVKRLHRRGELLTGFGWVLIVVGVVAAIVVAQPGFSADPSPRAIAILGGATGLALVMFLFGQIFHIRAAVEK